MSLLFVGGCAGVQAIELLRGAEVQEDLVDYLVAVVQEDATAGQFWVGLPCGVLAVTNVAKCCYQKDVLDLALLYIVAECGEAIGEAERVADGKFYILLPGQLDEPGSLLKIPGCGGRLEDMNLLLHRHAHVFLACVHAGGDEKAARFMLIILPFAAQTRVHRGYQLAVVVERLTIVL